ncbi:major outer membrane protein [Malaciobacter mytili]|uniref:major outer membrane protein n=1 Tax=Malaciobacter mytili TaxID=603050 RepID=UPI003A891B7A
MKKFAKMSLVAAVAVAGLSTTSSAKALEEAIKNVDVSGTVVYRYDDRAFEDKARDNDSDRDLSNNKYKIGLTLKSKVNDDVTAVTRFIVGSQTNGDFVSLNNTNDGDGQADISLNNVYFSYTGIANTTVNVGKQGLTTPWTVAVDADGNEQTGTGILALTNVGPVTLAGAYFNQTNLNKSTDVSINGSKALGAKAVKLYNSKTDASVLGGDSNVITVGAMANIGPVALDAWYLDMQDSFDTFTIGAKANFDLDAVKLSVGARHTQLDADKELAGKDFAKEDNSLTKIELGLKAGIFGANVNYGWTDSEGGLAALDNDALTGMQGYTVQLNGVADAKYLQVKADVQVLPSLNISLNYHTLDKDKNDVRAKDSTDTEIYVQASYQMSKNFGGYIRLGQAEFENDYVDGTKSKDNDGTIGRLQVQYSF